MAWTPYQIEIMLHHHCSVGPFSRSSAPAYRDTVDGLCAGGLLVDGGADAFRTTPLGAALVRLWCETPIPVQKFVDPRLEPAT